MIETLRYIATNGWFFEQIRFILTELHYAGSAEFTGSDGKLKKIEGDGSYLNEFDIVSAEMREGLKESRFITHSDTLAVMEMLDECRRQMNLKYDFED